MSKQLIQDMIKIDKKEPVSKKIWYQNNKPQTEKTDLRDLKKRDIEEDTYRNEHEASYSSKAPGSGSRHGLWVVAGISVLFLLFSFSFLFAGATITLIPRTEELLLNQNFSAIKDSGEEDLPFELVVLSGEETKNISGGEEEEVSENAEGSVVIYNAFGSATQRLDIDTRLEGSNGKIYKTKKQIIVPGMQGSTPGSIEVEIYATDPGEEYNSAPLDFKIFGFKGTPKYSKFYARSKGPIAGGFVGKRNKVSEENKKAAMAELKMSLEAKLLKKANDQIPTGFILFKNAAFFSPDEENLNGRTAESNIVPVSVKGTLFGIIFEEKALTKKIIAASFPGEEKNEVYIRNIRDLVFSINDGEKAPYQRSVLENITAVNFNLSGASKAVWQVDREGLVENVSGKKKDDFKQIMSQYPNILSVELTLRPFWKKSLPDEKEDIKLIITNSLD